MVDHNPKRKSPGSRILVGAWLLCILFSVPSIQAEGLDPVVTEIIAMLEGDVPETIILRWLPTADAPQRALSSEDLVSLKQAGASEQLLLALLDRSLEPSQGDSPETPSPSPPSTSPPPKATKPAAHQKPPARSSRPAANRSRPLTKLPSGRANKPSPSPSPAPSRAASPETAPKPATPPEAEESLRTVLFSITYSPRFEEEERPWDLQAYLDGKPLGAVTGQRKQRESLIIEKQLEPGLHFFTLLQSRHKTRKRSRDGWFHEVRIPENSFPLEIPADLPAGQEVEVNLEFVQPLLPLRNQGPISWSMTSKRRTLAEKDDLSTPADEWKPLCEEVEANLGADGKGPYDIRRQLKKCVRWDSLWATGGGAAPSWEDLHAVQKAAEFDPARLPE